MSKKCSCNILDVLGFSGVTPSKSIPPSRPKHENKPEIRCNNCAGNGCPVCNGSGFIKQ